MSKRINDSKPRIADVIVKRVCVLGGIRRDEGDYLVRDGVMTDGVSVTVLRVAIEGDFVDASPDILAEFETAAAPVEEVKGE